jgi:hypothetical protein
LIRKVKNASKRATSANTAVRKNCAGQMREMNSLAKRLGVATRKERTYAAKATEGWSIA